jgi:hypothetical protein
MNNSAGAEKPALERLLERLGDTLADGALAAQDFSDLSARLEERSEADRFAPFPVVPLLRARFH